MGKVGRKRGVGPGLAAPAVGDGAGKFNGGAGGDAVLRGLAGVDFQDETHGNMGRVDGQVAAGSVRRRVGDIGGYGGYGAVGANPNHIQGEVHIGHPEGAGGVAFVHEEHSAFHTQGRASGQALGDGFRRGGEVSVVEGIADFYQGDVG